MRVPLSLAVLLLALAGPAAAAPPPYAEAVHAYADPPTWTPPDDPAALRRIEEAARAARHPFRVLLTPHLPEGATAAQTIARTANGWAAQGMDPATNTVILRAYAPPRIEILAGPGYGLAGPALAPYLEPFRRAVTGPRPDVAGGIAGMIQMLDTSLNLQAQKENGAEIEALSAVGEQLRDLRMHHNLSNLQAAEAELLGAQLLGGTEGAPLTADEARARLKKIEESVKEQERLQMLDIFGHWAKWFLAFLALWLGVTRLIKRKFRIEDARQELDQMIGQREFKVNELLQRLRDFSYNTDYYEAMQRWGGSNNATSDLLQSIPPRLKRGATLLEAWEAHLYQMRRTLSRLRFWREEPRRQVAAALDREIYDEPRAVLLDPMTAEQEIAGILAAAAETWKALQGHIERAADEAAVQKMLAPLSVELGVSNAWYQDHPLQGPGNLDRLNALRRAATEDPVSCSRELAALQRQDGEVRKRLARLNALARLQVPDLSWPAIPVNKEESPWPPLLRARSLAIQLQEHLQAKAPDLQEDLPKAVKLGEEMAKQAQEAAVRAAFIQRAVTTYEVRREQAEAALKAAVADLEQVQPLLAAAAAVDAAPPTAEKATRAAEKASQLYADALIANAEASPLAAFRLLDLTSSNIGALIKEVNEIKRRCAELDRKKTAAAEKLARLQAKALSKGRTRALDMFHFDHSAPVDFALLYSELESLETSWTAEDQTAARAAEESARPAAAASFSSSAAYDGGGAASSSYSDTSSCGSDF